MKGNYCCLNLGTTPKNEVCVHKKRWRCCLLCCVGGKLMFKAGNYKVIYINTERKLHRKELGLFRFKYD